MDHIVVQSVTVPPASSSLGVDAPEAAKEGEMRIGSCGYAYGSMIVR